MISGRYAAGVFLRYRGRSGRQLFMTVFSLLTAVEYCRTRAKFYCKDKLLKMRGIRAFRRNPFCIFIVQL